MSRLTSLIAAAALCGFAGLAVAQTPAPQPFQSAPGPRATQAMPRQPMGQAVEYKTEAEAKGHCPSDRVVWANLDTKVYHFEGTHNFGKTLKGAYMCERDATTAGIRAAQNEKPQR